MTCVQMCPKKEQEIRKRSKMISKYESEGLLVKEYQRSSSLLDKSAYDPLSIGNIRNIETLIKTTKYLIKQVIINAIESNHQYADVYNFCDNRFQSIIQDLMIIIKPNQKENQIILEILTYTIKFYQISQYFLQQDNKNNIDFKKIHKKIEILRSQTIEFYSQMNQKQYQDKNEQAIIENQLQQSYQQNNKSNLDLIQFTIRHNKYTEHKFNKKDQIEQDKLVLMESTIQIENKIINKIKILQKGYNKFSQVNIKELHKSFFNNFHFDYLEFILRNLCVLKIENENVDFSNMKIIQSEKLKEEQLHKLNQCRYMNLQKQLKNQNTNNVELINCLIKL